LIQEEYFRYIWSYEYRKFGMRLVTIRWKAKEKCYNFYAEAKSKFGILHRATMGSILTRWKYIFLKKLKSA
jgi:hypothetical protein